MPILRPLASVFFSLCAVAVVPTAQAQTDSADVLIRGGMVVDGTGAPQRSADVAIRGDRIVFIGDASRAHIRAARVIDASGLVVAPGFIDAHTHTAGDLSSPARHGNVDYLMQGVTTVVTGNDGSSPLDIAKTLGTWQRQGIGTNAALFIGEGSVRGHVMGMSDAKPTAAQIDSMRTLVAHAMDAGALGISTGLYYAPGSYASTEEVIALSKVAAQHGGIYDTHLRDESSYTIGLIGAVNEAIRIGREAHLPIHISHIKALGADVWGQSDTVIALIKHARAAGIDVSACQYPYTASGTSVGAALLPRWAEAGGRDSLLARIADSATHVRLVADMNENMRRRGGAAALLITGGDTSRVGPIRGKTLAQVATARGVPPIDAALDVIKNGDAGVASFNMKESDIDKFMVQPFMMTCSDGSDGHPRKYGTFPRKLREYVYNRHVITLPQAVHASSALTAKTLGLKGRGTLAVGNYADAIVFDPKTVADRATYEQPTLLATGMRYVLVNGKLAVDSGTYTGALAGRPIRRAGSPTTASPTATLPEATSAHVRAPGDIVRHVEVRRTAHGVPHIRADNLEAAAYALAYVQLEDYGSRVALGLLRSRGEMGRWFGHDSIGRDFTARLTYARAVAGYPTLDSEVRSVYDGFAEGVNRYVELHPEEFPSGFAPRFTGYDVLAHDVYVATAEQGARFVARMDPARRGAPRAADESSLSEGEDPPDEGSNAWAFAPSRTKSGHAILLRNPHLAWNSGYYEAHFTVPGVVDFYGDFRVGSPFAVIGGFNRDLGWSTTNNAPLLSQIYSLDVDPARVDRYLLDGASVPLERELVTVEFRNGTGFSSETRESWRTSLGPVIYRGNGKIYVLRAAGDGDVRGGEQFLRMMRAHSLAQWKDAMRMRARINSNFTYADRAGNIFLVWNASIPALPQPSGGDTAAVPVHSTSDVWTHYVAFDSLPQLLNPKGGYVQNSNDPPYYTNMHQVLDRSRYPAYFPEPRLGLRTQLSLQLVDSEPKMSLENVLALKYSYRMLLADRVRDDLVTAVRSSHPAPDVAQAIEMVAKWDKTVAPTSRGGVLFELWWRKYVEHARPDTMYAQPWSTSAPTSTPRGIRFPARAAEAFAWATAETVRRYGSSDVAWGDVHRVRVGTVDVPVGGCNGDIGCFRVLWYKDDPDGKREAVGGDGWILGVEFGDQPRAYSVLAYGESAREDSPFHSDQAAMFARGEFKRVVWSDRDIEAQTIRRYRPGETR